MKKLLKDFNKNCTLKLEEEGKLARHKEEEDNLIPWDNTQAMMEADYESRKKHFARLRAEEQRRKPLTKAQRRNQMCTYLKNMAGFTHNDDQEEAEMKKHMEIVIDEKEIAVDAIPLATKSPIIVDWKIIKEGKIGYFQIIRADGSSRRYSSMIKMLQNINREDPKTLWKLVKAKHGNTRLEEAYERVLWGDLKVMFEPDIESDVWRNLQGYNVTVWKLFSSSGVHFVRFQILHIFMLVKKKSRILEVFECILLVKIKLLIKKFEDSEDEHQV
ncbi:hypothetical protein Tco_0915090 [Tanacetum coccineum]